MIQKIEFDFVHALWDKTLVENWTLVRLMSNRCQTQKLSLTLYMCSGIGCSWKLNFSHTQVQLKKLNLTLYMRFCISFSVEKLNLSQTQVKLKKMSLTLYMCCGIGFLAENWILVKLKSQSKNWVWLCTCAPALAFGRKLNSSQTQV